MNLGLNDKTKKAVITAHIIISMIAIWHFFLVGSNSLRLDANYIWPVLAVLFIICQFAGIWAADIIKPMKVRALFIKPKTRSRLNG
ncbi:MAG: hypothetical protein JXB24_01050 [Bacteroidales bacterium]|nr:hypothetical protein [Bacteroidales bacterium]